MAPSDQSNAHEMVWRQVHWPVPLNADHALGLVRRLASDRLRQPVIWETRCEEGSIVHLVGTAAHQIREVVGVVETSIPGAATSPMANGHERPVLPRGARLRVKGQALGLDAARAPQTARAILGALTAARFRSERAVLQVVLGRGTSAQLLPRTPADPTQSLFDLLAHGARDAPADLARRLRDKGSEPGFTADVRVAAQAASESRRVAILRGVLAALRTVQTAGVRIDFTRETVSVLNEGETRRRLPLRLSNSEVLALLAWPLEADDLPGLPNAHPKVLRLAAGAKELERTRLFASTSAPGTARPLGISAADSLFHTLAIGPTGSGKSTALLNLIDADMAAGRGVVVIDPKSDLIRDVLERVPPGRRDDIVVLDPTHDRTVGLNPLRVDGTSPELIADGILGIFRDLFPSAFGPRTSDVMHASLLTLAHNPGASLTWLPRLLTDHGFRASLIGRLTDPDELDAFWAQYSNMSERQQVQFVGPVLSRLRQFLLRPALKRVLEQSDPKFQLDEIFTKHRILLVPLNTGLLGNDAARLLGSLLVSQLWQLTLARAQQPKENRRPVSIYVDEVQEFLRLGGDLSDALARSRSLGVAWHMAHQYRDQLSVDMKAALDANARNKIVFDLGIKDAREMAAMAPELTAEDFIALPQYGVYANIMNRGQQIGWVSGQTLPPPPIISNAAELVAASQERYGREAPKPECEASKALSDTASSPTEHSIGRRKRNAP